MSEGRPNYVLMAVAAGLLAILVAALTLLHKARAPSGAAAQALTEEEKAYLSQIQITDARMSAAQNFLGDTLTYLDARVTNKGSKTIQQLTLELNFVDTYNQVVLREAAHPVTFDSRPLLPGGSRSFQVSFERIPSDWNRAPPRIRPVAVRF